VSICAGSDVIHFRTRTWILELYLCCLQTSVHLSQRTQIILWFFPKVKKVKVKLFLCFTKHHAMKTYWGSEGTAPRILDIDGGEWSASRPGRFNPRERAPGTHWIEGWVGFRDVLDVVVKRKIPSSRWELNPKTPIVQPVAQCYTNWAIKALCDSFLLLIHKISTYYPTYKLDLAVLISISWCWTLDTQYTRKITSKMGGLDP
jgi:hypothetical protein